MKVLKHKRIEKEFEFNDDTNYYLCIENPKFYRDFIKELSSPSDDETSNILLLENNKQRKVTKNLCFVPDPFCFARDEKKLNTSIQKDLASSIDPQENEKFLSLRNEINDYLESISYDYPLKLSYDSEMSLSSFLKAFSINYESRTDDFLLCRLEKIKILSSIFKYNTFIILNLSDFLTKDELNSFFYEIRKMEVSVLILSSHLPSYEFANEFIVRIDNDLCELHIESEKKKD